MLHQPSTRFATTEPAAEGLRLLPLDTAASTIQARGAAEADEACADQPWSHPARLGTPRSGATRLFIDCASL
jgi:hypothetical protein